MAVRGLAVRCSLRLIQEGRIDLGRGGGALKADWDSPDGIGSVEAESRDSPTVPAVLTEPDPGESVEEPPAGENGHHDLLQYLSAKKRKDLSLLLLELQEAQEEIAFLKGQLQDSGGPALEGDAQLARKSQGSGAEEGGQGEEARLIQSHSSSSSLTTVEIPEETPPVLELESLPAEGSQALPETPLATASQPQEPLGNAEPPSSWPEAEECCKEDLEKKAAEIERLQRLLEDSGVALSTLTAERDQLLSQVKELCSPAELKEQVRQLEGDLADAEKQRLSEHESGLSQLSLLKEQIQSLKNEAGSKEVKMEGLQKDLDEAQRRLAEQDPLIASLESRLRKEEQDRRALADRLREASTEAEVLAQSNLLKDTEADRLQKLLLERASQVERLRAAVAEREQQLAEVTTSMSNRMVQLNEEKFTLGKELMVLQQQLDRFLRGKETRDLGVGPCEEPGQQAEAGSSAGEELEALRKENEHVRKKLQAALVSRKELLNKIRMMEKPPDSGEGQPEEPKDLEMKESAAGRGGEEPCETSGDAGAEVSPKSEGQQVASPGRSLSAKEAEVQITCREKEPAVAELQALIAELQRSLREKDVLVGTLEAELEGHTKQQALESRPTDSDPEEQRRSALEEKVCALEQEKEQLQKKLQETVASRKGTMKKAQEKDRHHREQLKQQKDDYSLLQERYEEQSREKERIHNQLRLLQAQVEMLEKPSVSEPRTEALPEGAPQVEEPDWELPAGSEMGSFSPLAEGVAVEQLKAELEKLRTEKGELEVQLHHLEGELQSKSEAVLQLQEQMGQLLAEAEAAKAASEQAKASATSLRAELEESRAEMARRESLRLHQMSLEEQKELASKEEMEALNRQLAEKAESLQNLQAQLQAREEAMQALQGQLELQAKEQTQQPQAELAETQQKAAAEDSSRAQLQRKLQAALISRKEVLRESRLLQEELAGTKTALEGASHRLSAAESQASALEKEKGALLEKLEVMAKERGKLIAEVDKALAENQNLSSSCESLKLALEGVTQEKALLEQDLDALRKSQAEELSEWQRKLGELQREYETLLQSYENVSDEAERVQRVVEGVRQEKQELFMKLKGAEAEKREAEARLQGAEQEMEGMREKMRKFAKSKQQKILELEEENERLRAEALPTERGPSREEESSAVLQEELEKSKDDCRTLSSRLEALGAEKDSLRQEIWSLKEQLQGQETGKSDTQDEATVEEKAAGSTLGAATAAAEDQADSARASEAFNAEGEERKADPSCDEINGYIQQVGQLTERVAQLEEMREAEAEKLGRVLADVEALAGERKGLEEQLAAKAQELAALREKALRVEQVEEQLAGMAGLKEALEAEKDDLEERLMNQLAELNGSIGDYQQDAADLQSQNRRLLAEAEVLRHSLSRLEEEKRHLVREKAAAEAERKEHVEKLRSARKGDGERKTQAKELQELLKEKQQEVRQLQKDCIKSQEKVSSLERTVKALEFVQSESQKELEAAKRSLAKAGGDTAKARAELSTCRVLLDDTQSEAARVLAESLKAKEELQASQEQVRAQLRRQEEELERRLEEEKGKHAKELRNLEETLEARRQEQALSEGALRGLQEALSQKDRDAQQLQSSLNRALAQLAAFSRSMSSLQDDRDRVIDKSREWERKFSQAIEKKEQEVRAREEDCAALEGQLKQAAAQVEELQSQIVSLKRSKSAGESRSRKEIQQLQKETERLGKENETFALQLEEARRSLGDAQSQLQKQKSELQGLREQLAELEGSFAECKEAREEAEAAAKRQEAALRERRFRQEQLETDLRSSKELTDKLHEEISGKEQRIVSLLAAREEAVAAALSESQRRHEEELKAMESRMAEAVEERAASEDERRKALEKADRLLEKLKSAREESKKHKAQLDSFTKSMSSLQDDRDRVLGDYQRLEQGHLSGMLEKDRLIQEAAAESNRLKEEIRGLHGRMDDLHAENAKLDAELIRYREDLNRVIAIKDGQQKQLSRAQQERIQALEEEKAGAEALRKEAEQSAEALGREKRRLEQEAKGLRASLSQLQGEVAALQEGGPLLELQARLQAQTEEAQELSGRLSLAQQRAAELEEELSQARQAAARQLREAEAATVKELRSLRHDAGLMRNEAETAEERVAELARDLLETEQSLLAAAEENQDLKAQLQSFGKAMSSLQDSWDQANDELRAAEKKHAAALEEQQSLVRSLREEKAELLEEQRTLGRERAALASELAALRASVEEKGLQAQQLPAKEAELLRLTSELERASGQVKSFSQAMASLQDERDRLLRELDRSRREHEVKLQSPPAASVSLAEAQSLRKALSALQNDREQLVSVKLVVLVVGFLLFIKFMNRLIPTDARLELAELKTLQQQAGPDTAEGTRLKAQRQDQEQLRRELREEKATWEPGTKEQPLGRMQTGREGDEDQPAPAGGGAAPKTEKGDAHDLAKWAALLPGFHRVVAPMGKPRSAHSRLDCEGELHPSSCFGITQLPSSPVSQSPPELCSKTTPVT
ncbi:golgin subfamily B member 1-like [Heteronotia binoei]|uniref:golgin subfamily B member 1-like n=1 Tax=Heteronotia binoei TaxID=13085 RepID=UPI00292FDAB5|nr:golgin subfamily B member 1-like [Heteronotia binoei]